MDEEEDNFIEKIAATDLKNLNRAMDELIDTLTKFKAVSHIDELQPQTFVDMLNALEFGHFIVSGVMYSYGMNICDHDHDDHDDQDDE